MSDLQYVPPPLQPLQPFGLWACGRVGVWAIITGTVMMIFAATAFVSTAF